MSIKKSKLFSISLLLLILVIIIVSYFYNNIPNGAIITNNKINTTSNTNTLTMMYETGPNTGEYQVTSDTTWPQEGYVFNERLSGCENGSKLTWDDENKRVLLQTNTSDKCYVYFDKYTNVEITNVIASNVTSNSITINISASGGTNGIARYYYSSNNGSTWVNSTSSSYTFTNLSPGTQYTFRVYVEDTAGYESEQKTVSATTSNPTLADICAGKTFATCIKENVYTSDGENGLYYHNGSGSYTNANQEAGDNSYRYSGTNPNNYVCFGTDAATCPNDNLYRIIGVFNNQVKLIKNNSYGNYAWSGSNSNVWNTTTKPSIYTTLNTNFYNSIGAVWRQKISSTTWQIGGLSNGLGTPKNIYTYELGSNNANITETMYIGLMYLSDYAYAADPDNWNLNLEDFSSISSANWLYTSFRVWTISKNSSNTSSIWTMTRGYSESCLSQYTAEVKPTFYLNSNVAFSGGTGTSSDPYRLAV